jgi:hypothetical protein
MKYNTQVPQIFLLTNTGDNKMVVVEKDDVRELILVRGLPGSGKTRLASIIASFSIPGEHTDRKRLLKAEESISIKYETNKCPTSISTFATDDFFMVDNGVKKEYKFDPTKLHDYHVRNQNAVENQMQNAIEAGAYFNKPVNDLIIVHNTFTQSWEMEAYYELADTYGYTVTSVVVENNHSNKSIHNVPDENVSKMKDRFEIML